MKPHELIKALQASPSRNRKEEILKQALNDPVLDKEFFPLVQIGLNKLITFGIKNITNKEGSGSGLTKEVFLIVLQKLKNRKLTGHAALNAVEGLKQQATEDEWNFWYSRLLLKDLRCGVSEKTINKVVPKKHKIPVFSCMLATDSEGHLKKLGKEIYIEPKLDGVRAIVGCGQMDEGAIFSRNGQHLKNFPLISRALVFDTPNFWLDGEIVSGNFQKTMKGLRRKDVKDDEAVFHVFDGPLADDFFDRDDVSSSPKLKERRARLDTFLPDSEFVKKVPFEIVSSWETQLPQIMRKYVKQGYEGIMLKNPDGIYEKKRSTFWLKMKPFIEVTLKVVGVEEGTGKNVGRLGAFICSGKDEGKKIITKVGSGLTDELRADIWKNQEDVLGQLIEIRADALSQNEDSPGVYSLRFPRFLRFRGIEKGEKL